MRPAKSSQKRRSYVGTSSGALGSDVPIDHELFLQAFEKPTQIYRFLKSRNIFNPIFLPRNLYYMRGRLSRSHKNRSTFKLDSLITKVVKRSNDLQEEKPESYLNITFNGFHDERLPGIWKDDVACVETLIVKLCHKKRKESIAPLMETSMGIQDVPINPTKSDTFKLKPTSLSIPSSNFSSSNGHLVKSFVLVFKVILKHDQENVGEPLQKRSRLSFHDTVEGDASLEPTNTSVLPNFVSQESSTTIGNNNTISYSGEMVIFDKLGRCLLSPGEYELVLESQSCDNFGNQVCRNSPKKAASWETIESLKLEGLFNNKPLIKFNLHWSGDTVPSDFDRPRLLPQKPLDVILANSVATKPLPLGVQSPEDPQTVLYQFVYNNNSRQQTEARQDFYCPWCTLNCMALYSLLKHLKLSHARFNFTYVPHPKGARIDVALNDCYDGTYAGNPQYLVAKPDGFAFSRSGPARRTPNTAVLVCRPSRLKPSLSEFLEQDDGDFDLPRQYILGHQRLYHHSMSSLPIQPHELDEDSEGEHDNEWVREKTRLMIDEFTDVNEGEKEVMKMWNLHVMKYNFVGDCQIPLACSMFLEKHSAELLEKSLYRNFILHMISLYNFGLIGNGIIYKTILQLQCKTDDPHIQEHLSEIWKKDIFLKDRLIRNEYITPKVEMT